MSNFDIVSNILNLVQNKDYSTKQAISECFQIYHLSIEDKDKVFKIVYNYLNHFAYIDYVFEKYLDLKDKNHSYFLLVAIFVYVRYLKNNMEENEYEKVLNNSFYNDNIERRVKPLFFEMLNKEKLLEEELSINRKLSIYYNLPINLIRYLKKNFSNEVVKNILNCKDQNKPYFAINIKKAKINDFLNDDRFTLLRNKNDFLKDTAILRLDKTIKASQLQELKDGKIFPLDLSTAKAIDDIKYHQYDEGLLLPITNGHISSFLKMVADENKGKFTSVMISEYDANPARALYKRLDVNPEQIRIKDISLLQAYVPSKSKDLVIVHFENSQIGMMKRKKEVLLTLNINKYQENTKKMLEYLQEALNIVKEDGRLVFMTKSFFDFETKDLVQQLIEKNKDKITLVKDKTIFPYEYNSDAIYYAIFKRNK